MDSASYFNENESCPHIFLGFVLFRNLIIIGWSIIVQILIYRRTETAGDLTSFFSLDYIGLAFTTSL